MKINKAITIKDNQVVELEYYNHAIDGLNNLTIKIDSNGINISSYDDCSNEFNVTNISFNKLLTIAKKQFYSNQGY